MSLKELLQKAKENPDDQKVQKKIKKLRSEIARKAIQTRKERLEAKE